MKFSQPNRVNDFTAGFDSECSTCCEDILEGDKAGYIPGDEYPSYSACIRDYLEEQ